MLPFSLLNKRKRNSQLHGFAQEVSNTCRHAVHALVEGRCDGMSANELRGYVRARAGGPVRKRASQRTRAFGEISSRELMAVVRSATDLVVYLVVRDCTADAACEVVYRRAA